MTQKMHISQLCKMHDALFIDQLHSM
jgi:hypothetical protein